VLPLFPAEYYGHPEISLLVLLQSLSLFLLLRFWWLHDGRRHTNESEGDKYRHETKEEKSLDTHRVDVVLA
jgi:hypothetical protein